jgi:hypothetical protein
MDIAEAIVYELLKEKPITRTDDQWLYIAYWSKTRPDVSFIDFFKNYKRYKAKSYKSLERARRKVQAKYPELAEPYVQEKRYELEKEYEEYALKG